MTRARDIADFGSVSARLDTVGGSEGALSNRNLVINGAMQVSQRGTSEASVTSSQYADAPDRFKVEMNTAGTWTVSQSTTAPAGFSNSYKFDCTTADGSLGASDYIHLSHYFEGQNLQHLQKGSSGAQKVTLSFHVRSAKTGTYIVEFFDQDNNRAISKSYTIDAANTWEKKTITIDGDTSGALGNDNGASFGIFFFLAAGSNFSSGTLNTSWGSRTLANIAVGQVNLADSTSNDWYLTGVQLEVGDTATDFEHRSYGDELLRCQRYYQETSNATNYSMVGDGTCQTSVVSILFDYLCEMRTSPSISALGTNGSSSWYIQSGSTTISTASSAFNGAWAAGTNSQRSWMDWTGISGQTASNTAAVYRNNQSTSNKNGCLAFDAEF